MSDPDESPDFESSATTSAKSSNVTKRSLMQVLRSLVLSTWNPQPLKAPNIDPNLEKLSFIERITEVVRYQVLSVEYGLSSRGGLREWARVVSVLSIALAFPIILIVPLVTFLLSAAVSWTEMLFQITTYLLYTLLALVAFVTVALIAEQALYKGLEMRSKLAKQRRKQM